MTNGWVGSNDQSFSKIGLKVGDVVTLGTKRTSYNGTPQGGGNPVPAYYISHVAGNGGEVTPPEDGGDTETPEEDTPVVELPEGVELTSSLTWTLGTNSYEQDATINGVTGVKVLKLGKSKEGGSATVAIPEGVTKIGFLAVGWKGNTVALKCTVGTEAKSFDLNSNDTVTGNPPYTTVNANGLSVAGTDYYTVDVPAGTANVVFATEGTSNCRAIIMGINPVAE